MQSCAVWVCEQDNYLCGGRCMGRKRQRDLRDFWPWYERQTGLPQYYRSERPPFELSDLSKTPETIPPRSHRWWQGLAIAFAILVFVFVAWALFQ